MILALIIFLITYFLMLPFRWEGHLSYGSSDRISVYLVGLGRLTRMNLSRSN